MVFIFSSLNHNKLMPSIQLILFWFFFLVIIWIGGTKSCTLCVYVFQWFQWKASAAIKFLTKHFSLDSFPLLCRYWNRRQKVFPPVPWDIIGGYIQSIIHFFCFLFKLLDWNVSFYHSIGYMYKSTFFFVLSLCLWIKYHNQITYFGM